MELTNWVWPWLALFCKTKLVRQASCWLTEWCHQLNSRGATKARKWNFNFLLMLNDSLSYWLWPLCSSEQSILLLFFVNSNKPLSSSTFSSNSHPHTWLSLIGKDCSFLSMVWEPKPFFSPPPTCQDFTFVLGGTRFALKQSNNQREVGKKPFWLQSTLVISRSSHYLNEFCFCFGPRRHCLLSSLCSHCPCIYTSTGMLII